jgi:hypothetical protein
MIARMSGLILLSTVITVTAQTREQAVAMARAGQMEEAILALRSLIAAGDTSKDTAYDLAVILSWAKHPKEATDAFERTRHAGGSRVRHAGDDPRLLGPATLQRGRRIGSAWQAFRRTPSGASCWG